MTSSGGNPKKQEDSSGFVKYRKTYTDKLIEDGKRREQYNNEYKAEENWERKWGFLKDFRKLWEEEAAKRGLPSDILNRENNQRKPPPWAESKKPKVHLLPSGKVPILSSGFIGWRLFSRENDLDRLAGPLYVSKKLTVDPPLGPDEPDPRRQNVIFLG